jgi:peptide/nickel transport system substrate-binding protein
MAIALGGCSLGGLKSNQLPTLVLSTLSDPKTFNTVTSQESNPVFSFIEQGLVGSDRDGNIIPGLAESWVFSEDNTQITFTLRENLKWSDGHPLTVEDVLFTYNDIYLNEKIPTDFRDLLKIGVDQKLPTLKKVDERRVQFSIPEPFAPFLRYTGIGLMPKHKLAKVVTELDEDGNSKFISAWGVSTNPKEIVVPGAYMIESYRTGERVILKKNPYYWKTDEQDNPQPYIPRIAIAIVENTDTDLLQFRTGGLDITTVSPSYYSLLKQEEDELNFKIYNGGPSLNSSFIAFNLNQGRRNGKPLVDPIKSRWFNNLNFRKAIAHSVDRQKMLINIYQGLGAPQNSYIPLQSPYYLTEEKGLPVYDYDLDKAKTLLKAGGFSYNSQNQLLDQDGNLVRFVLYTNAGNKIREAMGAQIKQDLEKVGIQVDFTPIAFNTLVQKISDTMEWDSYLLGFGGGGIEPNNSVNVWKSDGGLHTFNLNPRSGNAPVEGRVVSDWEKEIDRLYVEGAQVVDESKRTEIYGQAQKVVLENLPFVYMVNAFDFSAIRNRIEGIDYTALGGATWNIEDQKLTP